MRSDFRFSSRLRGLLLILLASCGATSHPVAPIPSFVRTASPPLAALPPPDQASTGAYWLLYDTQQDIPTRRDFQHHAIKVLSEAGLSEASQISVDYEPSYEKIHWHRITLWRNGKPLDLLPRLKPTEMRREEEWDWGLLDGRITQLFSLEDVRTGDVVEYSYTREGDNPIFGDKASGSLWFRFGTPIARLHYRLLRNPGRPITRLALGGAPEPDSSREGDRVVLTWRLEDVGPRVEDSDAPSWHDAYARMQWGEYEMWGQVVDWALPLYKVEGRLSPELEKIAAGLRKREPKDRVREALRLVQDDIRYLGLEMGASSHRPSHPDKVYARRFGDCKDKSLLFCALLRRAGVTADPVLVNSRSFHQIESWRPSPLAFDHVIARVRSDGGTWWFDPTRTHQRGDPFAGRTLDYGLGLPIVPDGGGFDTIRPAPEEGGRIEVLQNFRVHDLARAATLEVVSTFTGAEADRVRALYANDSREELAKTYLNYYARNYPGIAPGGPLRFEDDSASNTVVTRESYSVDSLCRVDGGRTACSLYPGEIAHWVSEPDRRIRTSPYGLAYPKDIRQEIVVEMPRDIAFGADSQVVDHPDFRFGWNEVSEGSTLRLAYTYRALRDHVPLERFPAYLAALDTVEANMGAVLHPDEDPEWSLDHPNHFIVLLALVSLVAGIWIARRLPRIPPAHIAPADFIALPIGGALNLIGIFVVLAPVFWLYDFYEMAHLLDQDRWINLTRSGEPGYHPLWFWILVPQVAGSVIIWICDIALVGLFIRRHRSYPRAAVLVLLAEAALITWDTLSLGLLPESLRDEPFEIWPWAVTMVLMALMVAYLAWSERVRCTFVFPRKDPV